MGDIFFKDLNDQLQKGVHKKGHPFRYGVLGTVGVTGESKLRTVVLRHISAEFNLRFYTDARSNKIAEIKKNNEVSLLFYNPKQLVQVKVEGTASIITDKDSLKQYWSGVQPNARRDYMTTLPPGSLISNADQVAYFEGENFFTILEITPNRMEYLKLKRPNHLRIEFLKVNANWKSQFLVP